MKIVAFFNLIRWKNLALIALMQISLEIYFFDSFAFKTNLSPTIFYLLVLATSIITASGYIINDIIDLKTDKINKPKKVIIENNIAISTAKKIYIILTIIGIVLGIVISSKINKPLFGSYFIEIAALLFLYSKFLKGKVLIGNFIVSLLLAFSILIILLFNAPTQLNSMQWDNYNTISFVIYAYAICAFLINLIREIIKDIEDVDGDYNAGLKTFPIVFGRKTARNVALFITIITVFFFLFGIFNFLKISTLVFGYVFVFLFIPLLYVLFLLWDAKTKKRYSKISKLLKIIILLGVLSIPIISNHLHNAIN